jgi:cbb3-type cytochrome oxidase maturation protein
VEVIFLVLPLALLLGGASLWACVRAIRAGQFDDLDTPALRILIEEDEVPPEGVPRA